MNRNVIKNSLCAILVILSASCFKLQINLEGVVEDTVSAGKSQYTTIKRKKDGIEERMYTHTVKLLPDADERQIGKECVNHLTETSNSVSEKEPQILEVSTEKLETDSGNKFKCSIRAVL